jgi:hypothetical protein
MERTSHLEHQELIKAVNSDTALRLKIFYFGNPFLSAESKFQTICDHPVKIEEADKQER